MGPPATNFSVESILAVPVRIIFRQVVAKGQHNNEKQPLLTRSEADWLMKVAFLSHEIDIVLELCEKSLHHKRKCRTSLGYGQGKSIHPNLKPMTALLALMKIKDKPGLKNLEMTLAELMSDLAACSTALRQSAEQNWALAESLIQALDGMSRESCQSLAQEKRNLAEIEEELCQRIDKIMGMTDSCISPGFLRSDSDSNKQSTACRKLFQEDQPPSGMDCDDDYEPQPIASLCLRLFVDPDPAMDTQSTALKHHVSGNFMAITQPEHTAGLRGSQEGQVEENDAYGDTRHGGVDSSQPLHSEPTTADALAVLALKQAGP